MVCCALIAGLFGLLMPWRKRGALAWRPDDTAEVGLLRGRWRSVGFAVDGLRFAISNEANMRLHLIAGSIAVAAGVVFRIGAAEWRWITLAIALVVAGEAMNTGIEQACNAIGGRSEAIRRAKDSAAGGVLVLALAALAIGIGIFAPHIAALWHGGLPRLPICGELG